MSLMDKEIYEFGPFSLDPYERVISRDGTPLPLTPKVFDTLLCLVRNRGRLLTKDELLKEIWPDTFVEEVNLAVNISALRKAFGENPQDGRYIVTVPGRGYRFIAEVREVFNEDKTELNTVVGGSGGPPLGPEGAKPNGTGTRYPSVSEMTTDLPSPKHELERGRAETNGAGGLVTPAFVERSRALKRATLAVLIFLLLAVAIGYFRFEQTRRIAPAVKTASIAVLPFVDLSQNKDQEYFSDGLAEELINDLAKVQGVRVVARSSAFQFKGKNEDLRSVGQKLGVANILEGSVRREGDRVRIMAELIKSDDGFQLWSATYDRQIDDVFKVQDEIARATTAALQVKLLNSNGAEFSASVRSTNAEAYQAYLQAQYFFERNADESNEKKALNYADQAVKLDPNYAPAWALRSSILASLAIGTSSESEQLFREARQAASQAIALDPLLAAGYVQLGWVQAFNDWDWEGARLSLEKAAQLQPGSFPVLRYSSYLYQVRGQMDEAIATQREAIASDPLRARSYLFFGYQLYCAERYQEAEAAVRNALELNPRLPTAHTDQGQILLAQGRPQEALAQMEQEPSEDSRLFGEALAYSSMGRLDESNAALDRLITMRQKEWAFQIAQVYAYRGESDKAFEWLDRAYQQHDNGLTMLKADLKLKALRQDPRFTDLLKKMHLPA